MIRGERGTLCALDWEPCCAQLSRGARPARTLRGTRCALPSAQGPASACPAKSCPRTMVYLESGSPCMDTCSHLEVSSLCEEHRMDGCFCPEGECWGRMQAAEWRALP